MSIFIRKYYVLLALVMALFFFNCGGGATESRPELSPEVKQVLTEMVTLENLDESAAKMLESLRAETLTKANLDQITSDSIVIFETFASSNVKRYASSIVQKGAIKNYDSQQERSNVKVGANRNLTDSYELVEIESPHGKLENYIKLLNENTLSQELEAQRKVPKISNTVEFITIIKKENGQFKTKSYKK